MHGATVKKRTNFIQLSFINVFILQRHGQLYVLKNLAKFTELGDRTQLDQTVVTIVAFHKS
jgi:hypothetical protein